MNLYKKLKFDENTLIGSLFLLHFCRDLFSSVVFRIFGRESIYPVYFVIFCSLFLIYVVQHLKKIIIPVLLFLIVSLMFLYTYLIHPEYFSWFVHETYGFFVAIIVPGCALWVFPLIWLIKDEDRLYRFLLMACWLNFIFYTLQFIASKYRGYWGVMDIDKTTMEMTYNLEWGYNMLMPVSFFGACAFLQRNKKRYYLPFVAGFAMILIGGSRGAAIWPILMFPIIMPFMWRKMKSFQKFNFFCGVSLIAVFIIFCLLNKDVLLLFLQNGVSRLGITSRTFTSIFDGSIFESNGRNKIYSIALDLIKRGGLLGWGVYGDRPIISYAGFKWGYSHNLFLELLVSFGYFGGGIIIVLLLMGVITLYRVCKNSKRQIVFITFFVTSLKLMLSNSFWYTGSFWALIALMLLWRKIDNTEVLCRVEVVKKV